MHRFAAILTGAIVFAVAIGSAQQPSSDGPYRVVKTAKVGGEGGTDYIYADVVGRRLYIPPGARQLSQQRTRGPQRLPSRLG